MTDSPGAPSGGGASAPPRRRSILVVDDNETFLGLAARILGTRYEVSTCRDPREVLDRLAQGHFDVLTVDLFFDEIDAGMDGFELIEQVKREHPHLPIIVLSRTNQPRDTTRALDLGAFSFVSKYFERDELAAIIDRAIRSHFLERQLDFRLLREARIEGDIVHRCPPMQEVIDRIRRFAPSGAPLLITGETGTGKDLVALLAHSKSGRRGPFNVVNVTAFADTLFEAELFGHERGAFTDAHVARPGLIEMSDGGTLFVDEIGLLSMEKQGALLRVIEDQKVRRIGSSLSRPVDVRFVFATNEDLPARIQAGRFRQDLWYRINQLHVHLPPLRERGDDVLHIAEHLLRRKDRGKGMRLSEQARALLLRATWPGNVRELASALERAALYDDDGVIGPDDLMLASPLREGGPIPQSSRSPLADVPTEELLPYPATLDAISRDLRHRLIEHTLSVTGGNVTRAAKLCGVTRQAFYGWMSELGIERGHARADDDAEDVSAVG